MKIPQRLTLWVGRVAIAFFLLAVFFVMGGFFLIATRPLGPVVYVTGSVPVVAASPTDPSFPPKFNQLLRVVVESGDTGRPVVGARIEIKAGGATIATAKVEGDQPAILDFPAPPPGTPLRLVVTDPSFNKPYDVPLVPSGTVDSDDLVEITTESDSAAPRKKYAGQRRTTEKGDYSRMGTKWEGPLQVTPFPTTEITLGLPEHLLLVVRNADGDPAQSYLKINKLDGIVSTPLPLDREGASTHGTASDPASKVDLSHDPNAEKSDRWGIIRLPITAMTPMRWKVSLQETSADQADTSGDLYIAGAMSQLVAIVPPLVTKNDGRIIGQVNAIHHDTPLYFDIIRNGKIVDYGNWYVRSAKNGIVIPTTHLSPGHLYSLQVYGSIYGTENDWDTTSFWYDPQFDDARCRKAVAELSERVLAEYGPDWERWLETRKNSGDEPNACRHFLIDLVRMMPKKFVESVVYANTKGEEVAKLEAWKKETKSQLLVYLVILLVGGGIALVLLGYRLYVEKCEENRRLNELMLNLETEQIEQLSEREKNDSLYLTVMTVAIAMILIAFGYALVVVMSKV